MRIINYRFKLRNRSILMNKLSLDLRDWRNNLKRPERKLWPVSKVNKDISRIRIDFLREFRNFRFRMRYLIEELCLLMEKFSIMEVSRDQCKKNKNKFKPDMCKFCEVMKKGTKILFFSC